jgi:beta-galactosidase GanA
VTDANPSAWLDFYRFSSDQLRAFNRMQVSIIRDRSPNRFITHNMMGFFFQFDAFALAKETLDFVSWDSYPLGFTDTSLGTGFQLNFYFLILSLNHFFFLFFSYHLAGLGSLFSDDEKAQYFRTGHPDLV